MNTYIRSSIVLLALGGMSSTQARVKKVMRPTEIYHTVDKNISINARVFDKEETKELFKGKGRKLLGSRPVMPIEVVLTNQSDEARVITNIELSCKLLTKNQVESRLRSSALKSIASGALTFSVICASGVALSCVFGPVGGMVAWGLSGCSCPCGGMFGALYGGAIGFFTGVSASSYFLFKPRSNNKKQGDPITLQPGERHVCLLFTKDYDALTDNFSVSIV